MKKMSMMFINAAKDEKNRYWFLERKNQFIGYMYEDFKRVYPVKMLDHDMKKFASRNVYINNEQIFVTSLNAIQVLVYDICTNNLQIFDGNVSEKGESYNSVKYGNKIIFFPYNMSNATYIFDISTFTFSRRKWLHGVDKKIGIVEYLYEKGIYSYMPVAETNCMICLNLEDFSYEKIYFEEDINLNSVVVEDDGIWITQRYSETIIHFKDANYEYYECGKTEKNIEKAYAALVAVGDKIVALARCSKYIGVIEKNTKVVKQITDRDNVLNWNTKLSLFAGYYVIGERIILFPWGQELIYELDCTKDELRGHDVKMSEADFYSVIATWDIYEKSKDDLQEFCELVKSLEK